jgi:hypothetical protein
VQTLASHGIHTILDFHQDEYSGAYGGEGARRGRRSPAGCPTPRCHSRSTNSSIPRRLMPGTRSGRMPKHRISSDSKTITRRCWKRSPATSTATPTCWATRS